MALRKFGTYAENNVHHATVLDVEELTLGSKDEDEDEEELNKDGASSK